MNTLTTGIKVTVHIHKTGERCPSPYGPNGVKAADIKDGACIRVKGWELSYTSRTKMYVVHSDKLPYGNKPYYEFPSFNGAAAKRNELGRAHPSNGFDSYMNS